MDKDIFFWDDKSNIGIYVFGNCLVNLSGSGSWNGYFQIEEVDVAYKNLKSAERKRRFGDARFVYGGCLDGKCFSDCIMRAQTVGEAKREFEGVYGRMLARKIEDLQKDLEATKEVHEQFLIYVGES